MRIELALALMAVQIVAPGCASAGSEPTSESTGANGNPSAGAGGGQSSGASGSGGEGGATGSGAAGAGGGGAGGAGGTSAEGGAAGAGGSGPCTIPADVDKFLVDRGAALCAQLAGCCTMAKLGYDAHACEAEQLAFTRKYAQLTGCVLGVDQAKAEACLASFVPTQSFCEYEEHQTDESYLLCSDVVFGTKAPGQPCSSHFDCAPVTGKSVTCTDSGFGPTCRDSVLGAVGAACKSPENGQTHVLDCAAGLYCDGGAMKCRKLGDVGDSCGNPIQGSCLPHLFCAAGKCAVGTTQLGGECDYLVNVCAPGMHCDTTTWKCAKSATLGGPCLPDGTCAPIGGAASCVAGRCGIGKGATGTGLCAP